MKIKEVNIGTEITKVFESIPLSKLELAKRLNTSPQNLKRFFVRDHLDTKDLKLISEALGFNFFELYKSDESPDIDRLSPNYSSTEHVAVGLEKLAHAIEAQTNLLSRCLDNSARGTKEDFNGDSK